MVESNPAPLSGAPIINLLDLSATCVVPSDTSEGKRLTQTVGLTVRRP